MMSFCVVPVQFFARHALLVGERDVEREQPGGGRVDGHRRVHLDERDAVEQRAHVAEMGDRHADLADFAFGERVVAVVAGLCRQVEGDGEAGLALAQVLAIERVRRCGGRVPRIGAEDPRLVACFLAVLLIRHDGRIQSGNANVTRNMLRCNKRWSSRPVLVERRAGDDRLRIYHRTRLGSRMDRNAPATCKAASGRVTARSKLLRSSLPPPDASSRTSDTTSTP